jgi:hypothetical protein
MIMVQLQANVFAGTVPFAPDVRLPLLLTVDDGAPVRFLFAHVRRP